MNTVFWDKKWEEPFRDAMQAVKQEMLIISPFIQKRVVERLLQRRRIGIRVITRFNLRDFYKGVSDPDALESLVQRGAAIKGVRNLHAKVYVFDGIKAFVTSANLTNAALGRNHEFGLTTDNAELVASTVNYFETMWKGAGSCVTSQTLAEWAKRIWREKQKGGGETEPALPDFGADLGIGADANVVEEPFPYADAPQFFVKFFGESNNRAPMDLAVLEELRRSGSHWACTYPKGKRPRQAKDGAVMFMGRLVEGEDTRIYGRAIGRAHQEGKDDATEGDIQLRKWKARWPHYIRVRGAEFVGGTLAAGVSLTELMNHFGAKSFASTARNLAAGVGNTDPRHAYRQQAAVELTPEAARWLNSKLSIAMEAHGRIGAESLCFP
ncbi:MAG: phospholipase D-like domain-containing protein [bacterium]